MGIAIWGGNYNRIVGNYVGTDASGTLARGNQEIGVIILEASHNRIGGPSPEAGNVIAANGWAGVAIWEDLAQHNGFSCQRQGVPSSTPESSNQLHSR